MCFRIAWIDIFSMAKPIFGGVEFLRIERNDTEIVESAFMLGIEREDCTIKFSCSPGITLSQAKIAEREERFGIVGHVSISERKLALGERQIVGFQCLPAGVVRIERPQ